MYGQVMSLTDDLIIRYFRLCTNVITGRIAEMEKQMQDNRVNPRDLKMELAREIVKIYHGEKKAEKAEAHFVKMFQKKETPDEIEEKKLEIRNWKLVDLLFEIGLAGSKGEARRLIGQGGIKADGKVVKDAEMKVEIPEQGLLLQRGKRQFVKVLRT